jgi:hypothetical protein
VKIVAVNEDGVCAICIVTFPVEEEQFERDTRSDSREAERRL